MSRERTRMISKTMRDVKVLELHFVKDESGYSRARTEEVRNLVAQIIELSHKRGRPSKTDLEVSDAA